MASDSAKKVLAENLRQRQHKLAAIKQAAEELAAKMEGVKLSLLAKTSKFGVIFGSVTSIQLAEALQKEGFDIDRKVIYLKSPVKEVGEYTCQLRLHREVQVTIPFEVRSENHQDDLEVRKVEEVAPEVVEAQPETPAEPVAE